MPRNPDLSVVVIGRNEGERLVRCLKSVAAMHLPGRTFELIYVDADSIDGSLDRAASLRARVISVKPERPCAAVGRNAGWRAARASIVLFLDGDTTLASDFVEHALPEFSDPQVAIVFGDRRESNPQGSIYNRVLDLDWVLPLGRIETMGGDVLIRREALEAVDGYDEHTIAGEDADLCARIRAKGYVALHLDRVMVHHDLAIYKFSQYWRRSVRSGHAYAEISERFRQSDSAVWRKKAIRHRVQGAIMLALLAGAPLLALATRSLLPLIISLAIVSILVARTAVRYRARKTDWVTRIMYGVHSHLVHIPVLVGQLRYLRNRSTGKKERLIEYKEASPSLRTLR